MAKNCGNCYNLINLNKGIENNHIVCVGYCMEEQKDIKCICSPDTQCEKWVYSGAKSCKCRKCAHFLLGCILDPVDCSCFEPRSDDKFYIPDGNKKEGYYNGRSCLNHIENFFAFHKFLSPYENFYIGNIIKYLWRYKKKNGVRDLEKAKQYLEFLIEEQRGRK